MCRTKADLLGEITSIAWPFLQKVASLPHRYLLNYLYDHIIVL